MADFDPAPISHGWIPKGLSFEEVIKNKTASPCSLTDFMDYLYYVEHNAESLQFFLWYFDYVQRWSQLLPRQKALSPAWDPEKASEPNSRFITYSHKRARSLKMKKILNIMGMSSQGPVELNDDNESQSGQSSTTSSVSSSLLSPSSCTPPKPDWKPFTIPPLQTELTLIIRHYLTSSATSPRFLSRLSGSDLQACLRASQHTTHPSALLPAFMTCESLLRSASHPAFVSWARGNANRERISFLKFLAAVLVALGTAADAVLILSRLSPVFQTFGPRNDYSLPPLEEGNNKKGFREKIWDHTILVEDKHLMMLQDRAVFFSILWAGVLASGLTVGSLFVPRGGMF
ncbi:hypothetical protein QBC42DRAFT_232777 [Cladorrhinum samala]|uniref:RGS domain-containing protein n=1 Tax=Cladorrhinum samala TaxID=585594 RepID=A0AAV9HDP1_9PEZI|nr:hypothetical protein QBC42DRAFT_232777 [Cladorrhinum samala]